jgi:hypothetical protein
VSELRLGREGGWSNRLVVRSIRERSLLWSTREIRCLDRIGRASGTSAGLSNQLLCLLGIFASIRANCPCGLVGVCDGEILDLASLGVDDISRVVEVPVNQLLVLDIDKRCKEGDASGEKGEAPERKPLDKPVGQEGGNKSLECKLSVGRSSKPRAGVGVEPYTCSGPDILDKQDSLKLNDGKIDQLLEVVQDALKRLLANGEVPPRAQLGSTASAKCYLANSLSQRGDCNTGQFVYQQNNQFQSNY